MKKQSLIVLMFLMIVMTAVSASALQVSVTSMTLGGASQNRVADVTSKFRVTNDGNTTVNSITFSDTADSKYSISYTPASVSNLAPNAYVEVTVKGNIPLDFNAIETDASSADYLKAKALQIGTITVTDGTAVKNIALGMEAVNQLKFKKVTLKCGDTSKKISDGTKLDALKPDTACTIDLEVDNKFASKDTNNLKIGDISFDNAVVELEIDDPYFDADDYESINPYPRDYDDVSFDFDIDEEVEAGTYTLVLRTFGQDKNGAWHGEKWEVSLKVERLKHDLQIKKAEMSPEKMDCKGGKLNVDASIINLGRSNEDDVAVLLEIPNLGLSEKRTGIDLDKNDYTTVSFILDIPKDTAEGVYVVNLKTFFEGIAQSNTKTFNLVIEACKAEEQTEPAAAVTPAAPAQPAAPAAPAQPAAPSARVSTSDNSGFTSSNAYLGLLGVFIAVLVVIIIVLAVFMLKKPRK